MRCGTKVLKDAAETMRMQGEAVRRCREDEALLMVVNKAQQMVRYWKKEAGVTRIAERFRVCECGVSVRRRISLRVRSAGQGQTDTKQQEANTKSASQTGSRSPRKLHFKFSASPES